MSVFTATRVSVDDSPAVSLFEGLAHDTGVEAHIKNVGTDEVYLGPSDVTAATGYMMASGESMVFNVSPGDELFAICAAAETATVHVLVGGVG